MSKKPRQNIYVAFKSGAYWWDEMEADFGLAKPMMQAFESIADIYDYVKNNFLDICASTPKEIYFFKLDKVESVDLTIVTTPRKVTKPILEPETDE